jgi:hypothetical protein
MHAIQNKQREGSQSSVFFFFFSDMLIVLNNLKNKYQINRVKKIKEKKMYLVGISET